MQRVVSILSHTKKIVILFVLVTFLVAAHFVPIKTGDAGYCGDGPQTYRVILGQAAAYSQSGAGEFATCKNVELVVHQQEDIKRLYLL
jgi:hypothetical protein